MFIYKSYLVYFLLYNNADDFSCIEFNKVYDLGWSNPVTEWTPFVQANAKNEGFKLLIHVYSLSGILRGCPPHNVEYF